MKQVNKNIRKRIFRQILNFLFICFLIIVAVRAKGNQDCCQGTEAEDQTEIHKVNNDLTYNSWQNDTLSVNFIYTITSAGTDSFNYFTIYFYAIDKWWETEPMPYQISFTSDDTLVYDASVKDSTKRDTLIFTGIAYQDSYNIYVEIKGWKNNPREQSRQNEGVSLDVEAGDDPTHAVGPGGRQMVLFTGNRRICNCGDTLKDPYAYPLMVQIIDENGNGINDDTVWFNTNSGSFGDWLTEIAFTTTTVEYIDTTLDGIARPHGNYPFIFESYPVEEVVITIEPWAEGGTWVTRKVNLNCFHDNEPSGFTQQYYHETTENINKNIEIPGDGYNDGDKKTIKVEIDYAIDRDVVEKAVDTLKLLLKTARLDDLDANILIDDPIVLDDSMYVDSLKAYLAQYRDENYWKNGYLHMIVGTANKGNWLVAGKTVTYRAAPFGGYSHAYCAHLASTDTFISQYHLDSTGVIIYAEAIDSAFNLGHHESWDIYKALAVTMAHEIGHALGLSSHHSQGVMDNVDYTIEYYNNYNFYDSTSLNKTPPYDAMNTRDVLGIHTIDIQY